MAYLKITLNGSSETYPEGGISNKFTGDTQVIRASLTRGSVGVYLGNDTIPAGIFREGNSELRITIDATNNIIRLRPVAGELRALGSLHFEG